MLSQRIQTSDEFLEQLKAEEKSLRLRLASVQAAIDVYIKGQLQPDTFRGEATPPPLDDLRIRDAINHYLGWRQAKAMPPATLGELLAELDRHHVVTFKKQPMKGKWAWKSLSNTLGATENQDLWRIERKDPAHFTRVDTIELKKGKA
ncbi:MAG: hypothetical protein WAN69_11785 [Candidatus Korobacteraceae bacterium]|jgi:hypothetical protein